MYTLVHPSNIEQVWHLVAPWIAQAIGDSETWGDLDQIKTQAKSGSARIWIGKDAAQEIQMVLVSESWYADGRNTLVLRWCCGRNMNEWLEDITVLENWAAQNGFQAIHIWGRPGWVRACKPLDYKHEFTVISKPLIRGLH